MNDKTIIEKKIGHSTWIDITNPTLEKLQPFQKKYNLHQADINAILDNNIISKTYEHNNYLFIVIYANAINQDGKIIFQKFSKIFKNGLTKSILRDMMYYARRGMEWIFN